MSGEIEFGVRKGKPNGKNTEFLQIGWYPEWYLKVQTEDQHTGDISPHLDDVVHLIKMISIYEKLQLYDFNKKEMNVTSFTDFMADILNAISDVEEMDIDSMRKIVHNFEIYKETIARRDDVRNNENQDK